MPDSDPASASAQRIEPWPLGWSARLRYPATSTGALAGLAMALWLWAIGAFAGSAPPIHLGSAEQVTSMAIAYTALIAYLHAMFVYAARKTDELASELQPLLLDATGRELTGNLNRLSRAALLLATGAGVLLGLLNVDLPTVLGLRSDAPTLTDFGLAATNMLIWLSVARLVWVRAHNAFTLSRLGRRHVRVELYELSPLRVFARSGMLDLLLVVGALALTPLQALDAEFRIVNYLSAFSVGVPAGIVLLFAPMWGVRQRVREEQATALREVETAIESAGRGLGESTLLHLNALLERRSFLQSLPSWPLDSRSLSKVALSFVIPPLAWVAAALVEKGVERWLGG